jgi:tRNA modification GTPase
LAFTTEDTIVAIATPPGRGAIGVVRLSGPDAPRIVSGIASHEGPLRPRHATLARIRGRGGTTDRAILTYFAAPQSYTGEDVVEISAHGSPVLLHGIVAEAMRAGARLAEPGEFTLRAYLHGRIDLVQAEAVRDLIEAVTPMQARAAFDQLEGTLTADIRAIDAELLDLCARLEASLDFPEEGYHFVAHGRASTEIDGISRQIGRLLADASRGRLIREGMQIVFAGRPNSGKSSLFNQLAGAGRAIVAELPGTTRDVLTERVDLLGIPATIVDTAGVRTAAADAVEAEGIARAEAARRIAGAIVIVLDGSVPLSPDDRGLLRESTASPRVVVRNKIDLPDAWPHAHLLARARAALDRASAAASDGVPEEFVLEDLREARGLLEEVTGRRTPDDVLAAIFSSFCIGK